MIGSIRWNLAIGIAAFIFTFVLSIPNNIWLTSLLRSVYSFVVMFLIVFAGRWVLGSFAGIDKPAGAVSAADQTAAHPEPGHTFEVMTPDEDDELHNMLKGSMKQTQAPENAFTPLQPPKLSTKPPGTPEELAQAVRQMSEE